MAMEHACPEAWKGVLLNWDRRSVAALLLGTSLNQFDNVRWTYGRTEHVCPGWLEEVGRYLSWEEFSQRLSTVEAGDLRSLFEAFGVFGAFGHKLRRSMLRRLAEGMKAALALASLEDLRMPVMDSILMVLTLFFPDDARNAFDTLDVQKIGRAFGQSLPRHWRTLCELSTWAHQCDSSVCEQMIGACDLEQLQQQVRRYGPSNRYELLLLLHFIRAATAECRRSLAVNLRDVVRRACESKDSQARSIITAYQRLDAEVGLILATELAIAPEEIEEEADRDSLEATRQEFRDKDAKGDDYEIDLNE